MQWAACLRRDGQENILGDDSFPERSFALTRGRGIATAAAPGSLTEATEQAKRFSIAPVIRDGRDHCINLFSFMINAEKASSEGWKGCVGPWRPTL